MKKRILITGGASWVALDDLRIITNVFTGRTSLFLAKRFARKHDVTLLVNPDRLSGLERLKNMRVILFHWHDEFLEKIQALLRGNAFDCIIHAAALADFYPSTRYAGKRPSAKSQSIRLIPAPKALPLMRKLSRAKIVQFKLESGTGKKELIDRAYASLMSNRTDYVVANDYTVLKKGLSTRYLIDRGKKSILIPTRTVLAQVLEKEVFSCRQP